MLYSITNTTVVVYQENPIKNSQQLIINPAIIKTKIQNRKFEILSFFHRGGQASPKIPANIQFLFFIQYVTRSPLHPLYKLRHFRKKFETNYELYFLKVF